MAQGMPGRFGGDGQRLSRVHGLWMSGGSNNLGGSRAAFRLGLLLLHRRPDLGDIDFAGFLPPGKSPGVVSTNGTPGRAMRAYGAGQYPGADLHVHAGLHDVRNADVVAPGKVVEMTGIDLHKAHVEATVGIDVHSL